MWFVTSLSLKERWPLNRVTLMQRFDILRSRFRDQQLSIFTKKCMQDKSWSKVPSLDWRLVHCCTYLPAQGWRVSRPVWPTPPLWYLPASARLKSISAGLAHSSTMIPTCQCRIKEYLDRFGQLLHYDTYLLMQDWRVSRLVWPTPPLWQLPASPGLKGISASLAQSSTMVPTCQCRIEGYLSQLGSVIHCGTYLLLNIGSIRIYILMTGRLEVVPNETNEDVRMYTWRIYSSRDLDTLLHKVDLINIGRMQVYIHSQQRIEKCENCS